MSSYVIDKEEFIKVAAAVTVLQEQKRYGSSRLYLYNFDKGCLYDRKDIFELLMSVYACNYLSVCFQYQDQIDYEALNYNGYDYEYYEDYIDKSAYALTFKENIKETIKYLVEFIRCFDYQTEDEKLNKEGKDILLNILYKMSKLLVDSCEYHHFKVNGVDE